MLDQLKNHREIFISIFLMCLLYFIGSRFNIPHLFFPELAALCFGLFTNSQINWSQDKKGVILGPFLCSVLGVFCLSFMGLTIVSLVITFVGGLLILRMIKSSITPSISAGLFALLFNISSFYYSLNILIISILLLLLFALLRKSTDIQQNINLPKRYHKELSLGRFVFVVCCFLIIVVLARWVEKPELMLPPIFVLLIEGTNDESKFKSDIIIKLLLSIFLISYLSFALRTLVGLNYFSITVSLLFTGILIKAIKLEAPPLLALSLLPLIIPHYTLYSPVLTVVGIAFPAMLVSLDIIKFKF